jgi:hypothetical protein
MKSIPVDDRRMTLTVAMLPRQQSRPNPYTGEIMWDVDLLAVIGDEVDLMRVGVPDSGLAKNLVPLAPIEPDGLIARVWEKQDGRHGVMFGCDALRPNARPNMLCAASLPSPAKPRLIVLTAQISR